MKANRVAFLRFKFVFKAELKALCVHEFPSISRVTAPTYSRLYPTLCQITKHCFQAPGTEFASISLISSPHLYVLVAQGLSYSRGRY